MKEILRSLIPEVPDLQVLVVGTNNCVDKIGEISEYLDEFGGHVDLISYGATQIDMSNVKVIATVENSDKVEFATRGYEVLIIIDVFEKIEKKDHFLREFYHSLENSGNAFIFIDKDNYSPWSAKEDLEEANFVAVNEIELSENSSLLYAKKMHGWGGGM